MWPLMLSGGMSEHSPDCRALIRVPLLDSGLHLGQHPGQLLVLLLGDLLRGLANSVVFLTTILNQVSLYSPKVNCDTNLYSLCHVVAGFSCFEVWSSIFSSFQRIFVVIIGPFIYWL